MKTLLVGMLLMAASSANLGKDTPNYCEGMTRQATGALCVVGSARPDLILPNPEKWMAKFDVTREQVCAVWANNAVAGGSAALRDKPRKIILLKEGQIMELLEHNKIFDLDGIGVWDPEDPTQTPFIEESVFYGYDWVKRAPKEAIPVTAEQAWEMFNDQCLAATGA